jgi:pilus assembly protein CpaC
MPWRALAMAVAIAGAMLALPLALAAQTAPARDSRAITLTTGRGELLEFPQGVKQVAAAEPKIADVVVITPREVMVNAKEPGKTTVIVWTNGEPVRYDVDVTPDNTDFDNFRKAIIEQLPGSNVEVTGKGDTIVLTGTAVNSAQIKRATALAQTRAKTVVDMLTAPPEPEPRQIALQVKFASIDRTLLKEVGFNLFSTNSVLNGASSTQQFQQPLLTQLPANGGSQAVNFSNLLNLFVYRPDINLGATIAALEERDISQILAEPTLLTVDGKTASFLAGGQFPFPTITATPTGGGTAPIVTVQFKPFGVQLDFTPTIMPNGRIDLKVTPEVSTLDFTNGVTLDGFLIPAISSRKADTEVMLGDGESFAIAGLIDDRVIQTMDKVPMLGSIPILGQLFRSASTKKTNTELLVLITPHLMKPLTPDEKAKLPDYPVTFLPSNTEVKEKKDAKAAKKKAADFEGPRGHQDPQ